MNNTTISKKYLSAQSPTEEVTHLKVELYYSMGGWNYLTSQQEPKGYYLSVMPVKKWRSETGCPCEQYVCIKNIMVIYGYNVFSFVAFQGVKTLIKAVARKSKKAESEAIALAEKKEQELVAHITASQKIEII